MDNNWKVYVHTNKLNNKRYIGITSRKYPSDRWGKDGCGYEKNTRFMNAINKYGWDNFYHDVIMCNLTKEQACKIEISLIETLNTRDKEYGYNNHSGGSCGSYGDEVYILSVAREKKFIEKYTSVKECILKNTKSDNHKGKTLKDVLYSRNKIVIKSKYLTPIMDEMKVSNIGDQILYFDDKGDVLTSPIEGSLNQVVKIWVTKSNKIKISGLGFTDGILDGRVIHTKPIDTDKKKKFDDFVIG